MTDDELKVVRDEVDVKVHGVVDVRTKCGGRCVKRGIRP